VSKFRGQGGEYLAIRVSGFRLVCHLNIFSQIKEMRGAGKAYDGDLLGSETASRPRNPLCSSHKEKTNNMHRVLFEAIEVTFSPSTFSSVFLTCSLCRCDLSFRLFAIVNSDCKTPQRCNFGGCPWRSLQGCYQVRKQSPFADKRSLWKRDSDMFSRSNTRIIRHKPAGGDVPICNWTW